jgi:uncharacterized protein (DUF2384 family)
MPTLRSDKPFNQEAVVLTAAVIRAADKLGVSQKALAAIIGVSESVISRMRRGTFALERGHGKGFELAEFFVQLYVLLDTTLLGSEAAAKAWMRDENQALGSRRPLDVIQTVEGLVSVVNYLRARSGSG